MLAPFNIAALSTTTPKSGELVRDKLSGYLSGSSDGESRIYVMDYGTLK